ncbi:MAG: right-handed parallel beta-helix repeat-containing protein [Chloroflexi bacterium]|nr:right-handed parallel beta-helix repeat-containing protein [Chloroflexota bacterium]
MPKNNRIKIATIINITLFLTIIGIVFLSLNPYPSFNTTMQDCTQLFFLPACGFFQTKLFAGSQDELSAESQLVSPVISTKLNPNDTLGSSQVTGHSTITDLETTAVEKSTPASTFIQIATATSTTMPTATLVTQNVHFIATNGSDENPGTKDLPWKSLQYAAGQLKAGDTLYIRAGLYQEMVTWDVDGEQYAPITIMNYPGEVVIIDGYDMIPMNTGGNYLFTVRGDWYKISGLEIINSFGEGGVVISGAHVTIKDCFVHHNWGGGITIMGDYGLAQNNRIWYNGRSNEYLHLSRGGWPAAITCARYPSHCTLKGNISWENWGEGISTFEAYYTIIEENVSFDNMQNIYMSDTKYSVIQRNLVYCTPDNIIESYISTQNGILVGDEKQTPASSDNQIINNIVYGCNRNIALGTNESTNVLVAHNVFVNAVDDSDEAVNVFFYSGRCTNCLFLNNLVLQENEVLIGKNYGVGWEFSNNLWSKKPPSSVKGIDDILGDPMLSKNGSPYSTGWYQLQANSPAINNAIQIDEVAVDYFGISRTISPDIGAIEYTH